MFNAGILFISLLAQGFRNDIILAEKRVRAREFSVLGDGRLLLNGAGRNCQRISILITNVNPNIAQIKHNNKGF